MFHGMAMNEIDINYLWTISVVITVGVIGLTQLMKNFFKIRKGPVFTIISLIFTAMLCYSNSAFVSKSFTVLVDTFALSVAISQLAWDILAKAVPKAVGAFVDKALHSKGDKDSTDE